MKIKNSFNFPSILSTENNFLRTFSGDFFSRGPFFQGTIFSGIYGCLWVSMDVYGYLRVSMGFMGIYGFYEFL